MVTGVREQVPGVRGQKKALSMEQFNTENILTSDSRRSLCKGFKLGESVYGVFSPASLWRLRVWSVQ